MGGDVIFVTVYGPEDETTKQKIVSDPLWHKLEAVQQGRVYEVSDDLWMLGIGYTAADGVIDDPCRVYSSDVKLRVAEDVIYYPDVMVACGPEGDDPLIEDAPCLVVEVVSPSTESIDRREKMLIYRKIPSLRAYLIVDQERRYVERHWRDEGGEWRQGGVADEGLVPIPCPETRLSLDEIYEGLA